jgi:hypothetical protein
MSQGSFAIAGYEADDNTVRPIRVQPETIIAATNPEAAGNKVGTLVRVSGGRRKYGLKARSMTLKQNVGAAVAGFQPTRSITLPVFTKAAFAALAIGNPVQYNGSAWTVAGYSPEAGR